MADIDDIKGRLDVVDLISEHVKLQRSGRNFKANCPFHSEKTPSFIVDPVRQSWRCFGACATGGDIFSFIMKLEGVEFRESLNTLANKAGIVLANNVSVAKNETPAKVNQITCDFFRETLLGREGEVARSYLKFRGIDQKTADIFELGLSPRSGNSLKSHLLFHDIDIEQAVEAGVLTRSQNGTVRDFFWGRLMFPIHDMLGKVIGFGARALDDSMPKYINTSATGLFDKRTTLYALHLAREAIRKSAEGVVVEGYMDVIAAHQHGFNNVVASMGTALTPEQVGRLKRLAHSFVLALDQDQAGQEATLRSLDGSWKIFDQGDSRRRRGDQFSRETINLKVLSLPDGKDPDDFIRSQDGDWGQVVLDAKPVMDYLIPAIASRFDLDSPGGKGKVIDVLAPILGGMDPFDYDRYTNRIAVEIKANLGSVKKSIQANLKRPKFYDRSNHEQYPHESDEEPRHESRDVLVDHVLAQMFAWPELFDLLSEVSPDIFERTEDKQIYLKWQEHISSGIPKDQQLSFTDVLDQTLKRRYQDITSRPIIEGYKEDIKSDLKFSLARLEERYLKSFRAGMFDSDLVSDAEFEAKLTDIDEKLRNKKQDLTI